MKDAALKKRDKRYKKYVKAISPNTSIAKSLLHSFWIGGTVCIIGQAFFELYAFLFPDVTTEIIGAYMICTIVVIAIFLTGIGVFDRIGRIGGAGAFLPISGFANAMTSSAMEFKAEGLVFGSEAKFFGVVGPVLVNGIVFSSLAGLIHLLIGVII